MLLYSVIFGLAVFGSSVSQVLLKMASEKKYDNFIGQYLNSTVIVAYVIFFIGNLAAIYTYKVIPLSLGGILDATGYIYTMIFGVVIFKERLNTRKIVSIILILSGIVIYSISLSV